MGDNNIVTKFGRHARKVAKPTVMRGGNGHKELERRARWRKKQGKSENLPERMEHQKGERMAGGYMISRCRPATTRLKRDLRILEVKQKIQGTFNMKEGAQMFCKIRS